MITKDNIKDVLRYFGFSQSGNILRNDYSQGASIEVNVETQRISYFPVDSSFTANDNDRVSYPSKERQAKGFVIHRGTTLDFSHNENFVCLVCVHLLLKKGYEPKHIIIEPAFTVGHANKPSYGDVLVFDKEYNPLVLIENKTYGKEFSAEWNNMQKDGGQLFSYLGPLVNKLGFCENLILFAADFEDKEVLKSHIIMLKDNEKRIGELENPKTFKTAQGKFFDVWNETYAKSFETKGFFEDDIAAYSIGKLKYTINDLQGLSHAEIKPLYNEFATILRNNAITDFEHSFYILIDLFLCKITDERNNPDDLQFYYKGISRDTPKEYCARLLDLYQMGKKQIFDVDVINKDESDIEQVFIDTGRNLKNGLFAGIKELFEEVKFYNIKKFNFIDVENKEEFEMNFQILIKMAALIQDINLSDSETNHFFGDLFEGLLSRNVHQTEGQFFTPLPIVNFILKSLPQFANNNNLKVLDFACGAGHFLTEFIKYYPKAKVFGIEKSQPLSQVAKIGSIINGAKESYVVFQDSLSIMNTKEVRYSGFDKDSFDCIIANPPYSVKGFLNTLTNNDRDQYDLMKFVEERAVSTNGSIECFFVERAKQFLKQNGLMGIVLPSSILTNGGLYKNVRELIFENFNILAIVNLGSRTFGSTGTNTIILFAQKVKKNSKGLLDAFIDKNDYTAYLNYQTIDSYIEMQGYDKDDYYSFMQDSYLSDNLENNEIFVEYKKRFRPKAVSKTIQKNLFKDSSLFNPSIKANSEEYRDLFSKFLCSKEYREFEKEEFLKQFVSYAQGIEYDKLNTYIQIGNNKVLILQSPSEKAGKADAIKFLGYDWTNRKGYEGIKYLTSQILEDTDNSADEKDEEVVNAINSIKFIETPLYNPKDDYDTSKFAFAIRKHIIDRCDKFSFQYVKDTKIVSDYTGETGDVLSLVNLSDLIVFNKTAFKKSISLASRKRIEIASNYPLTDLESICDIRIGGTPSRNKQAYFGGNNLWVSIAEMNGQTILDTKEKITDEGVKNSNVKLIPKGSTLLSFKLSIGKTAIAGKDLYTNEAIAALIPLVKDKKEVNYVSDSYLFRLFNSKLIDLEHVDNKAFGQSLNISYLKSEVIIPLPPSDVQENVEKECKKVDEKFNSSRMSIDEYRDNIANVFYELNVVLRPVEKAVE